MQSEHVVVKDIFLTTTLNSQTIVERLELDGPDSPKPKKLNLYELTSVSFAVIFEVIETSVDLYYSERYIQDSVSLDKYVEYMGRFSKSSKTFVYTVKDRFLQVGSLAGQNKVQIELLDSNGNAYVVFEWKVKIKKITADFLKRFEKDKEKSPQPLFTNDESTVKTRTSSLPSIYDEGFEPVYTDDEFEDGSLRDFKATQSLYPSFQLMDESQLSNAEPPKAVDLVQQFGFWLNRTAVGQLFSKSNSNSVKTNYSRSSIWILGVEHKYREYNEDYSSMNPDLAEYSPCLNGCTGLVKRNEPLGNLFSIREVRLTGFASIDPIITTSLMSWLESKGWKMDLFMNDYIEAAYYGSSFSNLSDNEFTHILSINFKLVKKQDGILRLLVDTLVTCNMKFDNSKYNIEYNIARTKSFFEDTLCYLEWLATELHQISFKSELVLRETCNGELFKKYCLKMKLIDPIPQTIEAYANHMESMIKISHQGSLLQWSHISGWLNRWFVVDATNFYCFSSEEDMINGESIYPSPCISVFPLSNCILFVSDQDLNRFDIYFNSKIFILKAPNQVEFKKWIKILQASVGFLGKSKFSTARKPQRSATISSSRPSSTRSSRLFPNVDPPNFTQLRKTYLPVICGPLHPSFPREIIDQLVEDSNNKVTEDFLKDFFSLFWFTYRKDFVRIYPSLFTSDVGWGCMLRTGQSLLAQACSKLLLKGDWMNSRNERIISNYSNILNWLYDDPSSPFSVHKFATIGARFNTKIGEWFGPQVLANVIRTCTLEFDQTPFSIYVSQQNAIYQDEVFSILDRYNKPVLLLLPTRLGVEYLSPCYIDFIRGIFKIPQIAGIAGGKPSKSLFFAANQDEELFFLDPHILKPVCKPSDLNLFPSPDYHCNIVRSLHILEMDPSMLIGFLCENKNDFISFCKSIEKVQSKFEVISILAKNDHRNLLIDLCEQVDSFSI